MTVSLDLKPEQEARLQAKAQMQGVPAGNYLQTLVEGLLAPMTMAEAISLYAAQSVTQGQAATLANVSRSEFIDALGRAGISVFQYDSIEELLEEAGNV